MLKAADNKDPRWAGKTVACIASGPSLCVEDVALVREKVDHVIVVNATFRMAPWADVCYGADDRFWDVYWDEIQAVFKGEKWTMGKRVAKERGINVIGRCNAEGYSLIPGAITTGGNSGYQALHLAAYWGASRVVLLGYDMQRTGGQEHWHGAHKGKLPNGRGFPLWIRRFGSLARDLARMSVTVYNSTRQTALTCVPRVALEALPW